MAIEILTGVPGAGKSYYAVYRIHELLNKDDFKGLILHNIEGLSVYDNRCISCSWDVSSFSAEKISDYLRGLRSEYNLSSEDIIRFYIDEAQRFFPPELKNAQVLYFFDYHRHFGVDITLITQHEKKLTYKITTLSELEIRAVSSRINPFGSFVYKLSSAGEQFGTERLTKKPEIFNLYKSFQAGTGKAKKSKFRYFVLALIVLFPLLIVLFFRVLSASFDKFEPATELPPPPAPPVTASFSKPPASVSVVSSSITRPDAPPAPVTKFLGPKIKQYSSSRDSVLLDVSESGLEGWVPVPQYIADYPPHVYGYGYVHMPGRRFLVYSASNSELLFPVENPVFVRSFVRSDSVGSVSSSLPDIPPEYPLEYLDKSAGPDSRGYTREDYQRVFMRQQGFRYQESPAVPPQGAEDMQATAPAGAGVDAGSEKNPQF